MDDEITYDLVRVDDLAKKYMQQENLYKKSKMNNMDILKGFFCAGYFTINNVIKLE